MDNLVTRKAELRRAQLSDHVAHAPVPQRERWVGARDKDEVKLLRCVLHEKGQGIVNARVILSQHLVVVEYQDSGIGGRYQRIDEGGQQALWRALVSIY